MAENNSSAPLKTAEGAATLWCVHVTGADDVHPMPSREVALEEANALNTSICRIKRQDIDPVLIAVVAEWPHSADSHAAGLMIRDECLRMRGDQAVAARAATASVAAPDEREAFEQAFIAEKLRVMGLEEADPAVQAIRKCHLERYSNGDYPSLEAYFAWFAWQARAVLAATPALPATGDSSAGDLARHGMTPLDKATQDQIASVMLQHGTPEQQLQALATCCKVSPDSIKAIVAAAQAEVQAEPVALQMCSELRPRTESEKAAYLAGVADGRMYAECDADTAPQAQPADALDAAFEAVRKRFCKLPRYSFLLDGKGNVRRVPSFTGNWVEFEAAHTLFDPVAVDAAMAAAQEGGKA